MSINSLPWQVPNPPYDTSRERAALEQLSAAVSAARARLTGSELAEMIQVIDPEESAADAPAALKDLADETAGVQVGEEFYFSLLAEERSDLGPFTLLGSAIEYYPLFETPDEALILTINEAGLPGAVWWIDEDLDLHLITTTLSEYIDLVRAGIEQLDPALDSTLGEQIWQHVLGVKRSTVKVMDQVSDLDAKIQFSADGLTAKIVPA